VPCGARGDGEPGARGRGIGALGDIRGHARTIEPTARLKRIKQGHLPSNHG